MWPIDWKQFDEFEGHLARLADKKTKLDSHRPLPDIALKKIKESLFTEWTYNSNAIEGNTLTLRETRIVLEEGMTVKGKSLREHVEITNHHEAVAYLEQLVRGGHELRERDILDIHHLVMNKIEKDFAGRLRNGGVRITAGGFVGVATTTPQNRLDVAGNMAIGAYAGVNTAPANGLIVSGNVRIGVAAANTIAPAAADNALITFDVTGGYTRIGNYNSDPGVGGIPPGSSFTAGVGALAIGMNRTGGTSNVDFWNTSSHNQASANGINDRGFNWRRYNNVGAEQLLMTLNGAGNLTIAGTTYFTSDSRIKTNVSPMEDGVLEKLLQLQPARYNKTTAALEETGRLIFYPENVTTESDFGFLAQEVYRVFPELVSRPKDDSKELWAVDYARLSVLLVKALQEQQAELDRLKNKKDMDGTDLQKQVDDLKSEVEELKNLVRPIIYNGNR